MLVTESTLEAPPAKTAGVPAPDPPFSAASFAAVTARRIVLLHAAAGTGLLLGAALAAMELVPSIGRVPFFLASEALAGFVCGGVHGFLSACARSARAMEEGFVSRLSGAPDGDSPEAREWVLSRGVPLILGPIHARLRAARAALVLVAGAIAGGLALVFSVI